MGPIGVPEMMAIFMIALLLFGPKKLPELGRTLGKALTEFRRAKNELKSTFETHMAELERETRAESQQKYVSSSTTPDYSAHGYGSSSYPETSYKTPEYTGAYDENGLSEPPVEATVCAPHNAGELPPAAPAVEGAIPRTNGAQPVTPSTAPVSQEEHSA